MIIAADDDVAIDNTQLLNKAINNHRSVLANIIAAAIFFSPNFLLFIPNFRLGGWWVVVAYNAVIIFLLISTVSHVKFKN